MRFRLALAFAKPPAQMRVLALPCGLGRDVTLAIATANDLVGRRFSSDRLSLWCGRCGKAFPLRRDDGG
jgi:hypothetical protein